MGLLVHWNGWGKNIWAREYINTVLIEQRTETEKETQNIQGYAAAAAAAAKSHQSCPTLCDPMDWSLPGSSFHGILQARVLEWVAIAFSVQDIGTTIKVVTLVYWEYQKKNEKKK